MANTKSAKKATRKIARRTVINKARRTRVRSAVRKIEEAIASGNRAAAVAAMAEAEPALIRARKSWHCPSQCSTPQSFAADASHRQARQIDPPSRTSARGNRTCKEFCRREESRWTAIFLLQNCHFQQVNQAESCSRGPAPQAASDFCLVRMLYARVTLRFRAEEPMRDERLIGVNSQGVRFSPESSVTVFICSEA